jgi:hypothetical protein
LSKTPTRLGQERELAGWHPDFQAWFSQCLAEHRNANPFNVTNYPGCSYAEAQALWESWGWTATFRGCREALLRTGSITLDNTEWKLHGPARTEAEINAIPPDLGYERALKAAARAEDERRQRHAEANEEPDEPRRQYAGGRR